ncbi:type II toxin-antitoxin system VapC family toxin [Aquibium carbonis]|uniref:Type II toxin-antitoxin system VapC family toxin n=1 Tax=Aquibium carbonis TaxID=2495581 RepID=A0A429Z2G9_9HYPH|nr:type II toxin-antitoxin system VapC family toxin [Aquibium carbonis]RST87905.1 type II toxin-antitoxin system VapC family toxin [Aquibium carbonis]
MRLLLDTHVAIWATNTPERIPAHIRVLFGGGDGTVMVSAAAVWEIAIKHGRGRRDAPPMSALQAIEEFDAAGIGILDVTASHAAFVEKLPPLHGDPFDRLMLAQSIVEDMHFVTYDRHLLRYDARILTWP